MSQLSGVDSHTSHGIDLLGKVIATGPQALARPGMRPLVVSACLWLKAQSWASPYAAETFLAEASCPASVADSLQCAEIVHLT